MDKLFGNTWGLKVNQIKRLQNLYKRRVPINQVFTPELSKYLCEISSEINKQIGVLINRSGYIEYVIIGDRDKIFLPDFKRTRVAPGRLRGIRFIHTHLKREPLTYDDLTDLSLLRLDMIVAITLDENNRLPSTVYIANLMPKTKNGENIQHYKFPHPSLVNIDFIETISAIEKELLAELNLFKTTDSRERAILVVSSYDKKEKSQEYMSELRELAKSANLNVVGEIIQHSSKSNPKYVLGKGKIQELILYAMGSGAEVIIFDQNLSPLQQKFISEKTDLKIIDRTQLILDIFAQRAQSRDGKLQVELAQLKYVLPRLEARDDSLSRLTGGIGARGPGETKLEIDRRRVKEKILRLENEIANLSKNRQTRRKKREKTKIPIVSIIGYTNAGKSTLFNLLTHSQVRTDNVCFATLDPTSRRLFIHPIGEIILTDTVGFIRDLPKDLINAFKATLEELNDATILLHIVDVNNPNFANQILYVENIINELNLNNKPSILVFNKIDKIDQEVLKSLINKYKAIPISALKNIGIDYLKQNISQLISSQNRAFKDSACV